MPMDLGSQIVMARRAKSWTSSRLADEAGISRQQLSRIEHGHSEPTPATLERLRIALEAPLDGGEDAAMSRARAVDVLWDRLPPGDQREILDAMAARVAKADAERSFNVADDALALAAR